MGKNKRALNHLEVAIELNPNEIEAYEILRAERFQHYMTVMMFDLDKFKQINDTLGHPYGDYVIQMVSNILKENVRAIDLVARYGGE